MPKSNNGILFDAKVHRILKKKGEEERRSEKNVFDLITFV